MPKGLILSSDLVTCPKNLIRNTIDVRPNMRKIGRLN